jgi:hypothetical protein
MGKGEKIAFTFFIFCRWKAMTDPEGSFSSFYFEDVGNQKMGTRDGELWFGGGIEWEIKERSKFPILTV